MILPALAGGEGDPPSPPLFSAIAGPKGPTSERSELCERSERRPPLFPVHCEPEGPAAGAKRLYMAEGREGERSETAVPEATH